MMATGAENVTVKSVLLAAEFDLRTAAPRVADDLTGHVADLLRRAHAGGLARTDLTADEVLALVTGAFAVICHAAPRRAMNAQHTSPASSSTGCGLNPVRDLRDAVERGKVDEMGASARVVGGGALPERAE